MKHKTVPSLVFLFLYIFLYGSLAHGKVSDTSTYHSIQPDKCQTVSTNGLVNKVDNFMIIFDPSASMTETYQASSQCTGCHQPFADADYSENHEITNGGQDFARPNAVVYSEQHNRLYGNHQSREENTLSGDQRCTECHQDYLYSKFNFAKDLTRCFNQNIPNLELASALRLFGSPVYTMRSYGPTKYTTNEFDHELRKILDPDGASPLNTTLKAAAKDWLNSTGNIAVIVVSDGKDMDEKEVLAAEELKSHYKEQVCIYTVLIGGDENGKEVMEKIARAGQCGVMVNGDTLLDKDKMASFTKGIFLTKAPSIVSEKVNEPPMDSDEDGVIDSNDDCPETKPGLTVDENGCWKLIVAADVLFAFDKYVFNPEGIRALNQVNDFMQKYPFLDLEISGHTDNLGSMKYNIALSKNRALAGLKHLTDKGIDKSRLSAKWHSFSIPKASNDTTEGRALNRRLEFIFSKRK